jgi:pantothenate synthetase
VGQVQARILVAARVGTTRLIDNLPLTLGRSG